MPGPPTAAQHLADSRLWPQVCTHEARGDRGAAMTVPAEPAAGQPASHRIKLQDLDPERAHQGSCACGERAVLSPWMDFLHVVQAAQYPAETHCFCCEDRIDDRRTSVIVSRRCLVNPKEDADPRASA